MARLAHRTLLVLATFAAILPPLLALLTGAGPSQHLLGELPVVAFLVAGAYTWWKRPNHLAAQRLLLVGSGLVVAWTAGYLLSLAYLKFGAGAWFWLGNAAQQALTVAFGVAWIALLAVFPDGRYHWRYERWVVRGSIFFIPATPILLLLSSPHLVLTPGLVEVQPVIPSPAYRPELGWFAPILRSPSFVVIAALIVVQRYRRMLPEQRLQLRWPMFAAVLFGLLPITQLLAGADLIPRALSDITGWVVAPLMPLAIAIGLLRHQLMDIDFVIRRSLVYGLLWLAIAAAYVGVAAALGLAAGQRLPLALVILITIGASVVFQPARARLERLADRLVFGERLDGYNLIRRLGSQLESPVEAGGLAANICSTLRLGLRAEWVRISLFDRREELPVLEPIAAEGVGLAQRSYAELIAPLVHNDVLVGVIECGASRAGGYRKADEELVAALGHQAALAVRNSNLSAELAERLQELEASRQRIVQAEEAGRRRIERDIHDGVQQQLVALIAKVRLARNQAGRDLRQVENTLAEVQRDATQVIDDLRELARGIHPVVLSDSGLVEAIRARVGQLPIGVKIDAESGMHEVRYPEEVEGAAYFVICEALANTLKHSSAHNATVRLFADNGTLSLEVRDDGDGFDPGRTAMSGLRGLKDRVEALGGTVRVESAMGAGTSVSARLPIHGHNA